MTLSNRTWAHRRTVRLSAQQRRHLEREQALAQCTIGKHQHTPTFRPGETVCLVCGLVLSCPTCLAQAKLPPSSSRFCFSWPCAAHRPAPPATGMRPLREQHAPHQLPSRQALASPGPQGEASTPQQASSSGLSAQDSPTPQAAEGGPHT